MIYRPIASRSLWDTWILPHQGEYHLFHLESQQDVWSHVGHAVSNDLIHWQTHDSIAVRNSQPHWNSDVTLTGMVVPHDNRFFMFVGSIVDNVQVIGLHISDDLEHWEPYPDNPVIRPAGPHYLSDPSKAAPFALVDWRDPNITYNNKDGYYHAILCAHLPQWDDQHSGATVGHLRSKDLINWQHLPPIASMPQFYNTEVPDIFELKGTYYLLFQSHSIGGLRLNTPMRNDTAGVYYMSGPTYQGPFELHNDYHLFGSGNGKMEGYSGRSLPYRGHHVFYHHCHVKDPYRPAFGAPKLIRADSDSSLYLEYMPLLEKLETSVVLDSINNIKTPAPSKENPGKWKINNDKIVGETVVTSSALMISEDISDLHLQCNINISTANRAGIIIRASRDNNTMQSTAVAIWLDYERQEMKIGIAAYQPFVGWGHNIAYVMGNSTSSYIHDTCRLTIERLKNYHLRCFARDEHFEVYLDNRWLFTSVLSEAAKMGSVNLIVERGQAEFSCVRLAKTESLK